MLGWEDLFLISVDISVAVLDMEVAWRVWSACREFSANLDSVHLMVTSSGASVTSSQTQDN